MFRTVADNKPGDNIEVVFYRGAEKRTATMTLKGYPVPPQPADFNGLADSIAETWQQLQQEMDTLFAGITEAEASHKAEEWSVKENMAHLILSERWRQHWFGGLIQGPEVVGYTANATARVTAVIAVHPTLNDLRAEMNRAVQETMALLRAFPADAAARKANLWWSVFETGGFPLHVRGHIDQMRAAIAAARA